MTHAINYSGNRSTLRRRKMMPGWKIKLPWMASCDLLYTFFFVLYSQYIHMYLQSTYLISSNVMTLWIFYCLIQGLIAGNIGMLFHTARIWIWMTKRPGVASYGNFNSYLIGRSWYNHFWSFSRGRNVNNIIYPFLSTWITTWTEPEALYK